MPIAPIPETLAGVTLVGEPQATASYYLGLNLLSDCSYFAAEPQTISARRRPSLHQQKEPERCSGSRHSFGFGLRPQRFTRNFSNQTMTSDRRYR